MGIDVCILLYSWYKFQVKIYLTSLLTFVYTIPSNELNYLTKYLQKNVTSKNGNILDLRVIIIVYLLKINLVKSWNILQGQTFMHNALSLSCACIVIIILLCD